MGSKLRNYSNRPWSEVKWAMFIKMDRQSIQMTFESLSFCGHFKFETFRFILKSNIANSACTPIAYILYFSFVYKRLNWPLLKIDQANTWLSRLFTALSWILSSSFLSKFLVWCPRSSHVVCFSSHPPLFLRRSAKTVIVVIYCISKIVFSQKPIYYCHISRIIS